MFCEKCGAELQEGTKFCTSCGARTKLICEKCGTELPQGTKFCTSCGASLGADDVQPPEKKEKRGGKAKKKHHKKTIAIVAIVVAVVAALIIGIALFYEFGWPKDVSKSDMPDQSGIDLSVEDLESVLLKEFLESFPFHADSFTTVAAWFRENGDDYSVNRVVNENKVSGYNTRLVCGDCNNQKHRFLKVSPGDDAFWNIRVSGFDDTGHKNIFIESDTASSYRDISRLYKSVLDELNSKSALIESQGFTITSQIWDGCIYINIDNKHE